MNARRAWLGFAFVAPATAYLALFSIVPMLVAAWMSLHRWHLLKPERPWVGFGNYLELAADPFFRNAVYNSLVFTLMGVPLGVASALAVAVLVAQPLRAMGLFRTIYFIPAISSPVALSILWIWVFLPEVGLVNFTLSLLSLPSGTDFLTHPAWAMPALVLLFMWTGLGPRMLIFLTGIQSIPQTLYEAADLDGAGTWQRFRYVTLPLLLPTTLFVVVTSTIAAFQWFTAVYIITRGGPRRTTDVVAYHIYKEAWQNFEMGMASAQTYVLFAMILAMALIQFWLMRRGLEEDSAAGAAA